MISKAERQTLRDAIKRARKEVKKSGIEHIERALTLVNGRLSPECLQQAYEHLIKAIEHSRISQPLLVARANALAIAAALAVRKRA